MLAVIPSQNAFAASCPSGQANDEDEFRLTSIPGKIASDESLIEVRMGVKNISGANAYYKVDFFVDTFDASNLIATATTAYVTPLTPHAMDGHANEGKWEIASNSDGYIPNGQWGLFSYKWDPPSSYVGTRWLQQRTWRRTSPTGTWVQVDWSSDGGEKIRIVDTISTLKSPSYFGAVFVEPGRVNADINVLNNATTGAQYVYDRVEEMAWLGIETLVIAYPELVSNGWGPYYNASTSLPDGVYPYSPAAWPDPSPGPGGANTNTPDFDLIGTIIHAACIFDMKVAIGLGRGHEPWIVLDTATKTAMNTEADQVQAVAADLYNKYGKNPYYGKAFWGFYNSFETNTFGNNHGMYFYDRTAGWLDQQGPDLPMLVSPAGTPTGISGTTLSNSLADIFLYQDSVGAGYVDTRNACVPGCGAAYSYTYVPANRIGTITGGLAADLGVIFNEYKTNHGGAGGPGTVKHIWSNTEAWRQANASDYAQSTGSCKNPNQLKTQLETERWYVGQMMVNEMFANFKSWRNTNAYIPTVNGSAQWYIDYSIYWTAGAPNYTGSPAICP